MDRDKRFRRLHRLAAQHASLTMPRVQPDLGDLDLEFYEEDGYLVGLVSRYLSTGNLDVAAINVKSSIDRQLAEGTKSTEVVRYRSSMLRLARALSEAAGVPLVAC